MAEQTPPQPPVRFRLLSVGIEQYSARPLEGGAAHLLDIDASYTFELTASERRIATVPRFAFRDEEGQELAIIQPIVHFDILPENWPQLANPPGSVTLPVYLLQHLAVIATGFARGVLYEKFSREPGYEGVMLPIIPVVDYIKDDLTFAPGEST